MQAQPPRHWRTAERGEEVSTARKINRAKNRAAADKLLPRSHSPRNQSKQSQRRALAYNMWQDRHKIAKPAARKAVANG